MINPMMMAQFKEMMKGVKSQIRIEYAENRMIVHFTSDGPESAQAIQALMGNLGIQFAQVMGTYMGIPGEIVEVGKAQ